MKIVNKSLSNILKEAKQSGTLSAVGLDLKEIPSEIYNVELVQNLNE